MKITISTRSRNLGYGWTNDCEQVWNEDRTMSSLQVREPNEDVRGGPRTVRDERSRAFRINNGNDWRESLFVGGHRVVYWQGSFTRRDIIDIVCGGLPFEFDVKVA